MPSPKTKKDVQTLIGKISALNWFISKCLDKYKAFLKLLKGVENFIWIEFFEQSFQKIKAYKASN